jgi:hypothetical protein
MDAFTFVIGLTLAVAGFFLYRDYARFLRGAYAKQGKVISIQQVFSAQLSSDATRLAPPYVRNGFYPVIEYSLKDGPIQFTAIDKNTSGSFHVGDQVKLRIIKTRRKATRVCHTFIVLVAMVTLLSLGMISAALSSSFQISIGQVFLASCVVAASLSMLIFYLRDQDQLYTHELTHTKGGRTQLCLAEPTAFKHWKSALLDPAQRYKIRSSQLCGATCMGTAMITLTIALQPLIQFTVG